jgi:hypothetical protein
MNLVTNNPAAVVKRRFEADVRTAYIDLQVAGDQVALAESNRKRATQTLQQSQDRFAVGVADSVEVVNSQESLSAADHDYVNSMFSQHMPESPSRTLWERPRRTYRNYLRGKRNEQSGRKCRHCST